MPPGKPTLALDGSGTKFTFAPASPDAAITYVFMLEGQDGNVFESPAVGFADLVPATEASKAYTWTLAPSGQFKGKVRWVAVALQVLRTPQPHGRVHKPAAA